MADIPILFSAPMVSAILNGRKTMTRRILSPQPKPFMACDNKPCDVGLLHVDGDPRPRITLGRAVTAQQVRYAVGDRLWVRESLLRSSEGHWRYAADGAVILMRRDDPSCSAMVAWAHHKERDTAPSIHMPRWASRLTLIVDAVKIERLQDINPDDAAREGIARAFTDDECRTVVGLIGTTPTDHGWTNYLWHGHVGRGITQAQADAWPHQFSTYKDAQGSFASLWARINGPAAWDANPFIVALTFRVIKANIDSSDASAAVNNTGDLRCI